MNELTIFKKFWNSNSKLFNNFLDSFVNEPRIAWYPSAGKDFHALKFFSDDFLMNEPADNDYNDPALPDFFIYTDYYPWNELDFLNVGNQYTDSYNNNVITEESEFLGKLNLPLHPEIVDFPEIISDVTNKVYFLKMKIQTQDFGEIRFPIIYAFVENEAFCFEELIPSNLKITHIVHVRYGGGRGGGGKATGFWIQKILKTLNCEIFITDGHLDEQCGDSFTIEKYEISMNELPSLLPIREIQSERWSNHGKITWNLIK